MILENIGLEKELFNEVEKDYFNNTKTHEEFRDHFVTGNWKNTCEPFDVYFPSEHNDEDGFYNDKEEWISFGEWCGANEW